jgi:hypothetical protein
MAREMVIGDAVAELTRLQEAGVLLTSRSLQVSPDENHQQCQQQHTQIVFVVPSNCLKRVAPPSWRLASMHACMHAHARSS